MSGASIATRRLQPRGIELSQRVRAVLGAGSVAAIGVLSLLFCLTAAAGVSFVVPATRRSFTDWLAGPLHGIVSRTLTAQQTMLVLFVMCVFWAGALLWARVLPQRVVFGSVVALIVLYTIAPPLISKDIFSYISYARLGARHGVDPYTHGAFLFPNDPAYPYLGWKHVPSAYGPLFTVATYPLAFVSVPVAMWTIKVVTAIASLGLVGLVWRCAQRLGRDPVQAVIWVGLNPILLVYGVGGAHNDLIMLMFMVAAVALVLARREGLAAASIVVSVAVKASGAVMLPFLFLRSPERRRVVIGALIAFVPLVLMSYAAFGSGTTGQFKVLKRQQLLVSSDSIPAQLGNFLGLGGVTSDVRLVARLAGFAALAYLAWRVWRGTIDWIAATGWSMIVFVVTSSWLLGWYALWPLPFAALSKDRRLQAATLGLLAYFVAMRWTVFI
jgi:Glycosyltransferase family 87